jgi:RHS repeat-associated protein
VDAAGRRIGRKVNGSLTQSWLYQDGLKPIAELDSGGNVVSRFVYAGKANVPEYMVKGGVEYRLLTDHLGSVRLVVNVNDGTIGERLDYDEFGQVLHDSNPGFQPFGFDGGLYDSATALVRFGSRDFDAKSGRWLGKDPVREAGGVNLYLYVNNDPLNQVDQNGHFALSLGFLAFDTYKAIRHAIEGNTAQAWHDVLWVAADAAAVAADTVTLGTGGELIEGARIALTGAKVLTKVDVATAAIHAIDMAAGGGGANNWRRFQEEDGDNCPSFEKMGNGNNDHFNDMFSSVMENLGIPSREDPRWELAHRAVSGKGINNINDLESAVRDALGMAEE